MALIAEDVLPRNPPGGEKFTWTKYDEQQAYTVPDTKVGRKSAPTEVSFQGEAIVDQTMDYGLDDVVPNSDIQAYDAMPKPAMGGPLNPLVISTTFLTSLIGLDREKLVGNLVFNAANYSSSHVLTLSGTSKWDNYANVSGSLTQYQSTPVMDINTMLAKCLVRPNTLIFGKDAWLYFSSHPAVLMLVYGNLQGAGVASPEAVAAKFRVKRVLIGEGWINTARKGQAANYVPVWGPHAAAIFTSDMAAQIGQPCWGFTHQFGTRLAGELPEPITGLRGCVRVRVGESLKEVVSAPDCGVFFQNVCTPLET